MAKPTIDVTIDEDGNVTYDVNGTKGASCLTDLKIFERALGVQTAVQKKPEFFVKVGAGPVKVGK